MKLGSFAGTFRAGLVLLCLLLTTHRSPAPVVVLPPEATPKPKASESATPKPKPKPAQEPKEQKATLRTEAGSETSRRYVGTWSGSRTGTGAIDGRDRRYPYSVSSPISVSITNGGRTATVRLSDGELRWPNGGPDGQSVSAFTAKPNPSFTLREDGSSMVGSYRTTEGNWVGDRLVRIVLDGSGETIRLTIEHTGRNRSSGVSDSSTSSAVLRRK